MTITYDTDTVTYVSLNNTANSCHSYVWHSIVRSPAHMKADQLMDYTLVVWRSG